ncbi:MAG: dihydrodipicolinate synthase family protein [bacterium]
MPPTPLLPPPVAERLREGCVIPAHPLALTAERKFDEKHQRALSRYYLAAGAGGLAVGVHTTQFQIRDPKIGLLQPVLELAAETIAEHEAAHPGVSILRIAGICGRTPQATAEAALARDLGYHLGLLSLGAFQDASVEEMIGHARAVAEIIPVMGFYLQPTVGGRVLDFSFWRRLFDIPAVVAVKIAPFNRYQTLDVIRAVAESGRAEEIALYTGNDDAILADLLTVFEFPVNGRPVRLRVAGGLLGHWAVWTRRAVEQLEQAQDLVRFAKPVPRKMLTLAAQVTDCNAAFFDAARGFAGCIAGLHEVLRRQGLMRGRWCLDPAEDLSPGQMEEIGRVYRAYPHLNDDEFVARGREEWLR